jgi:hypothetical protein
MGRISPASCNIWEAGQPRVGLPAGLECDANGREVLTRLGSTVGSRTLAVIQYLFAGAFFGYAMWVMLLDIFTSRRVTFNTVCASLCVYLLLGVVWALAYSMVDVLNPAAFTWTVSAREPPRAWRVGKGDGAILYFSFATLTTLGYGDIIPTSPFSRMLATLEAITGQLYLTVLVARLVGMHIAETLDQKAQAGANAEKGFTEVGCKGHPNHDPHC